jgi:NADPH-dependent 2,4-dienoyl-CoA reductase/sulfur reductase-like enzyme
MNESSTKHLREATTDPTDALAFTYCGEELKGKTGDSIASAMVRNAKLTCRENATGQPGGIFCGMGVCNECQVELDGDPGVLSCMRSLEAGAKIMTQEQHRHFPLDLAVDQPDDRSLDEITLNPDILIIGGGPAGLSLTRSLVADGLSPDSIIIIDERKSLGGQYFKQRQLKPEESGKAQFLDAQFREGAKLIDEVRGSGVRIMQAITVWAAFDHDHIAAYDVEHRYIFKPRELVLATGAYERGIPMPGWTLPGVMTTGAAQTLLRSYSVSPGREVLVSGNGPLNLQMAAELSKHGTKVVALIESGRIFSPLSLFLTLSLAIISPTMSLRGLGYFLTIKRARIKYFSGAAVSGFSGSTKVERAEISSVNRNRKSKVITEFAVDSVAMGFGFISSNELARNLRCDHEIDPVTFGLKTKTRMDGRTSREHIWVIGDSASINGAQVAKLRGTLLATSLLSALTSKRKPVRAKLAQIRLYRHYLFQRVLWKIYRSPRVFDQFATRETVICRCLSITQGELIDDLREDMTSAGALKRVNRVGMGKCQGRYCSPFAQKLIANQTGVKPDSHSGFAPQVPIKPTSISTIAYS